MNKTSVLCIIMVTLFVLTGCEIFRTGEAARNEIEAFFEPPQSDQANQTNQDNQAIVRLQPAATQLNVGQITRVDLIVENVTDLVGVDIQILFTPAVFEVQDAIVEVDRVQIKPGSFFPANVVTANEVNNDTGTIIYRISQTAPVSPANGSGILASFNILAIGPGESAFSFSTLRLVNSTEQNIATLPQVNQITVAGAQQPPTNTPIPTAAIVATTVITIATPTPTPTATPTSTPSPLAQLPPGATVGQCYRVQHKDTLGSIAYKFGTSPQNIQIVNDLFPPGHIYVQKALFVPSAMMGGGPNFYLAEEGDTYASIARTCNLPADFLEWVNEPRLEGIENLSGQYIEIPIPPFPPPAKYPYPRSGPFGPPSVYPPPSIGPPVPIGGPPCGSGCSGW